MPDAVAASATLMKVQSNDAAPRLPGPGGRKHTSKSVVIQERDFVEERLKKRALPAS